MNPYDLVKIVADVIRDQQNEIDTYKIVVSFQFIVIALLLCLLASHD